MENQKLTTSQRDTSASWTSTEIESLSKALAIVCVGQNAYGTEKQFEQRFDFWVMKLEGRFTVSQILQALDIYTDRYSGVPTPSDIIKIIAPEPAKITQTEYITAKENWAREGFKSHCYWKGVMNDFEKQEGESRQIEPIAEAPLSQLIGDITKKLENINH